MTCPCDERSWPPVLHIRAGLRDLPRQLVTFAELRAEMLARARFQPALSAWRARARDDYGLMLIEAWAYVGELLSIYDKAIADESYVRTAKLRPSLTALVAVLGYRPRPAVAATAEVALLADGVRPVTVAAGTAFRSGAFADQAPQMFELATPATIHPALNRWTLATPPEPYLLGEISTLLLDPSSAKVAADDVVMIELNPYTEQDAFVRKVKSIERIVDDAGRRLAQVTLDRPITAQTAAVLSGVRIFRATRHCDLKGKSLDFPSEWQPFHVETDAVGDPFFVWKADRTYNALQVGQRIIVEKSGEFRCIRIQFRIDRDNTVVIAKSTPAVTIDLPGNQKATVESHTIPAVMAPFTYVYTWEDTNASFRKETPSGPDWVDGADPTTFTLHFALHEAGHVLAPLKRTLSASDPLRTPRARKPIGSTAETDRFLLRDVEQRGVALSGGIDLDSGVITRDAGPGWNPLAAPVEAFGNVVTLVRGQTVPIEILGDGNAAQTHQAFALKKKPLTYVAAPGTDAGVASTLTVWVDGLEWIEVPTLFGCDGSDRVYVVRQDNDAVSTVTFGDGIRGARLPTGIGNVVASYRFGAGEASPPAGSIAQMAKPVVGLKAVLGPVSAGGGADAEPAAALRALAPRSAVLLGRAISIDDMEAAALQTPGAVTARTDWTWDGVRQRPVVMAWIIGDTGVISNVAGRLRALTEPNTPINVVPAQPVFERLAIDLELDPQRVAETTLSYARTALLGPHGWLMPAQLGIGQPLFRSQLIAALLTVRGVIGVRGLTLSGKPWTVYGINPGVGRYFDLQTTSVTGH
jgi:predicted phage baseplate assembly protein